MAPQSSASTLKNGPGPDDELSNKLACTIHTLVKEWKNDQCRKETDSDDQQRDHHQGNQHDPLYSLD